jgi:hypothetical protein
MASKVLRFKNPGTLDMRFMELMGVSVKDDNAIGMFGTGLKYAIATIMRLDGELVIHSKAGNLHFSDEEVSLRGKKFRQVVVTNLVTSESQRLGFTTDLGKLWAPWMAIREIYSNCLDEKGSVDVLSKVPEYDPECAETRIYIIGNLFSSVWENRGEFFIDRKEIHAHYCDNFEAYEPVGKDGCGSIFYKGIKVCDINVKSVFKYNILSRLALTEDRTADIRQVQSDLCFYIVMCEDEAFLRRVLMPPALSFEASLDYDMPVFMPASPTFLRVMEEIINVGNSNANEGAIEWYLKKTAHSKPLKQIIPTKIQYSQIQKSKQVLGAIGFHEQLARFPIIVVEWLGQGKMGLAKEGKVYLSQECFAHGTKYVCSTILEEFVHLQYGLHDESRQMQTWLFDRIIHIAENFILEEAI